MIKNMSPQMKSWHLLKAANLVVYYDHEPIGPPDDLLYNERYMHEACKVVLWAYANDLSGFIMWLEKYALAVLIDEDGFRKMLDKILELAIEAGIVEVNHES